MIKPRAFFVAFLALAFVVTGCRREDPEPPAPVEEEEVVEETEPEPEPEPETDAEYEEALRDARAILEEMVFFEFDRSRITPETERVLRQKLEVLQASPAVRLRLEGHTDERGSAEYNLALGNRRAESVRQFLTDHGLGSNRFETVSYGLERPLVDESNEEAWAQNRRVEFIIVSGEDQIVPPGFDR